MRWRVSESSKWRRNLIASEVNVCGSWSIRAVKWPEMELFAVGFVGAQFLEKEEGKCQYLSLFWNSENLPTAVWLCFLYLSRRSSRINKISVTLFPTKLILFFLFHRSLLSNAIVSSRFYLEKASINGRQLPWIRFAANSLSVIGGLQDSGLQIQVWPFLTFFPFVSWVIF